MAGKASGSVQSKLPLHCQKVMLHASYALGTLTLLNYDARLSKKGISATPRVGIQAACNHACDLLLLLLLLLWWWCWWWWWWWWWVMVGGGWWWLVVVGRGWWRVVAATAAAVVVVVVVYIHRLRPEWTRQASLIQSLHHSPVVQYLLLALGVRRSGLHDRLNIVPPLLLYGACTQSPTSRQLKQRI